MTSHLRTLWSRFAFTIAVVAIWIANNVAWAQEAAESSNKASGGAAYVAPYALAILCVGVGVAIVCNPSHRRERAKAEDYQQKL